MKSEEVKTIGLGHQVVKLKPHNPEWEKIFQREKEKILGVLGEVVLDIQHVGSTAIPGISAKPIIDIAVLVTSLGEAEKYEEFLKTLGYQRKEEERKDRILFIKGAEENRMVYVHIGDGSTDEVREMILFRDCLLHNPEMAEKYTRLKQKLAEKYPYDRKSYTSAKAQFIKEALKKFP